MGPVDSDLLRLRPDTSLTGRAGERPTHWDWSVDGRDTRSPGYSLVD